MDVPRGEDAMIYLTRLEGPYQFPSPYQVHSMVGDLVGKQPHRCLYRYDHRGTSAEVWVQTKAPLGMDSVPGWKTETQALDLADVGTQLGFRVRLNPTVCVEGKKRDLIGYIKGDASWFQARERAIRHWFDQRAEALGFRVGDFAIEDHRWREVDKPGYPVCFGEVDVAGILTVTDKAKLIAAVENGLGRERAFGCGLMFLYEVQ